MAKEGLRLSQEFPVSEAVFNFMNAWSLMFLPVMLADPKAAGIRYKVPLYLGIQVRHSKVLLGVLLRMAFIISLKV